MGKNDTIHDIVSENTHTKNCYNICQYKKEESRNIKIPTVSSLEV